MGDKGFVLILTLVVLSGLLLLGLFTMDHFLIESKINYNLYLELKTHYLAQAGIEYAFYRLKEEPTWRTENWMDDLGEAGQIRLKILEDSDFIIVWSGGIYKQYEVWKDAYFTKSPPITRIK
ncbi:hypothetical protein BBF96_09305 [Anoxybacter fermentans]|uniref:Uncharacterized protein n=1 Tax=Anoxybacter fermentans TaxID=1323375 RepID=A0A3Q9HQM3_9FIRM|nr:hypothetical protein [Anoxybacter fermentans]AZR73568.1 hypothetical protein BBF96_09305 [Anoxybacter fermentans]